MKELNFSVNMDEFLPLRDVVFNTLRQAILRGELKPGERLMEIQLANKLGVSRTPIREAMDEYCGGRHHTCRIVLLLPHVEIQAEAIQRPQSNQGRQREYNQRDKR